MMAAQRNLSRYIGANEYFFPRLVCYSIEDILTGFMYNLGCIWAADL